MKKIILSMCFLAAVYAAQAQVTVGPKLGLNVFSETTTYGSNYSGSSGTSDVKANYQFGVVTNIQITKYFSIRPELLCNRVGGIFYYGTSQNLKGSETLTYAALPVNFVGTFKLGPGKLNVFLAPQFSLGLGGNYKNESTVSTETGRLKPGKVPANGGPANTEYYNPFDLALNYGIGYQVKRVLFTAQYSHSMSSSQAHYEDAQAEANRGQYMTYNRGFTFALTYFFGKVD